MSTWDKTVQVLAYMFVCLLLFLSIYLFLNSLIWILVSDCVDLLICLPCFCFAAEINPGCFFTCQNGGSCLYINETHNAECVCPKNYFGEFCESKSKIHPAWDLRMSEITFYWNLVNWTLQAVCRAFVSTESMCGIAPVEPNLFDPRPRIVGGEEVVPGAWPWQLFMQTSECFWMNDLDESYSLHHGTVFLYILTVLRSVIHLFL